MARQREDLDSLNGMRMVSAYYFAISEMGAIGLHQRQEIKPGEDQPKLKGKAADHFSPTGHEVSLPDYGQILQNATWSTFSAQSSKVIQAHLALLRQLDENDEWFLASRCWQSALFAPRTVIWYKPKGVHYLVLGTITHTIMLLWEVEEVIQPGQKAWKVFIIGGQVVVNRVATLLAPLDLDQFDIVPTEVISPVHFHLLCKRETRSRSGVVLSQAGDPEPVMYYCACRAFFKLQLPQLKTIASEHSIDIDGVGLPLTLQQVCRHFIEKHRSTEAQPYTCTDQEMHSILALRFSDDPDLFTDIADEDLLCEVLSKDELEAYQALSLSNYTYLGLSRNKTAHHSMKHSRSI